MSLCLAKRIVGTHGVGRSGENAGRWASSCGKVASAPTAPPASQARMRWRTSSMASLWTPRLDRRHEAAAHLLGLIAIWSRRFAACLERKLLSREHRNLIRKGCRRDLHCERLERRRGHGHRTLERRGRNRQGSRPARCGMAGLHHRARQRMLPFNGVRQAFVAAFDRTIGCVIRTRHPLAPAQAIAPNRSRTVLRRFNVDRRSSQNADLSQTIGTPSPGPGRGFSLCHLYNAGPPPAWNSYGRLSKFHPKRHSRRS
jgi:hypothetical protein